MPAPLANAVSPNDSLPIRAAGSKSANRALVDSVIDDPRSAGMKIIKLLVQAADFPAATRASLKGMKFDVLLPHAANGTSE